MEPLIQAAIEAAKAGEKDRAQGYLKQLLTANPNHLEGWLVMAALLDHPERKQQCLNRALQLDPANQIARSELLKLDRAAMGAPAPQPVVKPVPPPPVYQPEQPAWYQPETPAPPARVIPTPQPTASKLPKPLVFTYPLWVRISTYVFTLISLVLTCLVLFSAPDSALMTGFLFVVALGAVWVVSAKVEISDGGIRSSRWVTGAAQIAWGEIAKFKSNATSQNMTLTGKDGRKVKIASQVGGYGQIVELLRRKRPDLFGGQAASGGYENSPGYRPAFAGKKVFKRSSLGLVISYLIGLACIGFGIWGFVGDFEKNWGLSLIFTGFGLYLLSVNLFSVLEVTVEAGQITLGRTFDEEQFSPAQVKWINLRTVRGRRGRVTHLVVVQPVAGGTINLSGLSGGPELLYGTLMNWWQSGGGDRTADQVWTRD